MLHIFSTQVTWAAYKKLEESVSKITTRLTFLDKLNDRITKLEEKGSFLGSPPGRSQVNPY